MRIAFLGLGKMGSAMARLLLAKHEVTVWNRSPERAEQLVAEGATAASTPVEAVTGARLVFTMMHDDAALESVLHEQGALNAMAQGAIHVSTSTISVGLAERLETEHARRKHGFVGAPVYGRPNVAAEGKLWIVAGGQSEAVNEVKPVLELFSRGITVISDKPSLAHAAKLGGNFLITAMIASLSEAFLYVEEHGLDKDVFLQTITDGLFQSPLYANYGKVMLHPSDEEAPATVKLGAKDLMLFREAAKETATRTPLADIFQQQLNAAIQAKMGDKDWAVGYLEQVRSEAKGLEA